MRPADWVAAGILPMRDHNAQLEGRFRNVLMGCRMRTPVGARAGPWPGRDLLGAPWPETKDLGGDEDTQADLNCANLWPAAEERDIAGWTFGPWASQVSTPIPDDEDEPTTAQAFPFTVSGGALSGGPGPKQTKALPIRKVDWKRDQRFKEKDVALPDMMPALPRSWPGVVTSGTEEHSQEDLFIPGGGILCAPYHGGWSALGTLVFDATDDGDLDRDRKAHLQSAWRVYEVPKSPCAQTIMGRAGKHGLAIQCGIPRKNFPGLGMYADSSALASTSGAFPPQTIAPLSYRASGPLHPGFGLRGIHGIGQNGDGDEFSAGGIAVEAYYLRAPGIEGPLEFGGDYQDGADLDEIVRVHLGWDPIPTHGFVCGPRKGMWRWWTTTHFYTPGRGKQGIDEPGQKGPSDEPGNKGPADEPGGKKVNDEPGQKPPQYEPGSKEATFEPGSKGSLLEHGQKGVNDEPGQKPPQYEPGSSKPVNDEPGQKPPQYEPGVEGPSFQFGPKKGQPVLDQSYRENPTNVAVVATRMELQVPQISLRGQNFSRFKPDLRNVRRAAAADRAAYDDTNPTMAQFVGVAAQKDDAWTYTLHPGQAKYPGGSASGAVWVLPGDADITQLLDGIVPPIASTVDWAMSAYAALSFGTPTYGGKVGSGFRFRLSGGAIVGDTTDATGAVTGTQQLFPPAASTSLSPCITGDGSDGTATCDGSTAVAGMSLLGSTYTMQRDCYFDTLTINSGVTVRPNDFRLHCKTLLDVQAGSVIQSNGANGDNGHAAATSFGGSGGGHSSTGAGSFVGGGVGGDAGLGAGSNGQRRSTTSGAGYEAGGAGGGGGAGANAGGTSPTPTAIPAGAGGIRNSIVAVNGKTPYPPGSPTTGTNLCGGVGGGGGGGTAGTSGGAGGGGGGTFSIIAKNMHWNGSIQAKGGNGGNAINNVGENCGGGGGGGGGAFWVTVTGTLDGTQLADVSGGAKGTGINGGADGTVGSSGQYVVLCN